MVVWFRIEGMEEVRTKEWLPTAYASAKQQMEQLANSASVSEDLRMKRATHVTSFTASFSHSLQTLVRVDTGRSGQKPVGPPWTKFSQGNLDFSIG
jgi:hypothetical protein